MIAERIKITERRWLDPTPQPPPLKGRGSKTEGLSGPPSLLGEGARGWGLRVASE